MSDSSSSSNKHRRVINPGIGGKVFPRRGDTTYTAEMWKEGKNQAQPLNTVEHKLKVIQRHKQNLNQGIGVGPAMRMRLRLRQ